MYSSDIWFLNAPTQYQRENLRELFITGPVKNILHELHILTLIRKQKLKLVVCYSVNRIHTVKRTINELNVFHRHL